MLLGYDSVNVSALPVGADLYFGYINGAWPNYNAVRARFRGKPVLSIAVNSSANADVLDIERGDATPADAPGWVRRQQARGVWRPVVYSSQSQMPQVLAALAQAGIGRAQVRVWSAHYIGRHVCSPATCRAAFTADATQWGGYPGGGSPGPYDITSANPTFLPAPPKPAVVPVAYTKENDDDMALVITHGGDTQFLVAGPLCIGLGNTNDARALKADGIKSWEASDRSYAEVVAQHAKLQNK